LIRSRAVRSGKKALSRPHKINGFLNKGYNRLPCLALMLLPLFLHQQASNNFPQSNPLQDPRAVRDSKGSPNL